MWHSLQKPCSFAQRWTSRGESWGEKGLVTLECLLPCRPPWIWQGLHSTISMLRNILQLAVYGTNLCSRQWHYKCRCVRCEQHEGNVYAYSRQGSPTLHSFLMRSSLSFRTCFSLWESSWFPSLVLAQLEPGALVDNVCQWPAWNDSTAV